MKLRYKRKVYDHSRVLRQPERMMAGLPSPRAVLLFRELKSGKPLNPAKLQTTQLLS